MAEKDPKESDVAESQGFQDPQEAKEPMTLDKAMTALIASMSDMIYVIIFAVIADIILVVGGNEASITRSLSVMFAWLVVLILGYMIIQAVERNSQPNK